MVRAYGSSIAMKSSAQSLKTSPAAIAQKAASMPWKENARIDLMPYEKAIVALRERGYSYGEIATWLAKELNAPVKRGQVYYVCQVRAAETQEQFEEAERKGEVRFLPNIKLSPEEAERAAMAQDEGASKAPRKTKSKK